ncbi:MAG: hypothetical protein NTY81_01270, partial [Candidatus Staskawiczbacteria bacterium]|nr:hypothetical protein [Candidatus Staskawiczbacteria bacterium]
KVTEIKCDDDPLSFNGYGSFKIAFKTPGVYYCLGECNDDKSKCSGYMSGANLGSQDDIGTPFAGKIKGIRIVNVNDAENPENDYNYGVIFHQVTGLENGGQCSVPIALDEGKTEGCKPVNIDASAADIFEINTDVGASGDGVTFYSEPYGWDAGARASSYGLADKDIIDIIVAGTNAVPMSNFDHTSVDRPLRYKDICPSFANCPGSVKIKGSYLVGLYSSINADGSGGYCQTFTKDIPNLNVQQIIASSSAHINSAYIIPTK